MRIPVVLAEFEQRPDFRNARIVEQHVESAPSLVSRVEDALDLPRTGDVRLDRNLPKLIGEPLCAVTVDVRQQQLRALAGHASGARGADAAGRAGDEHMNAVEPISHLTVRRNRFRS
jgi:hypothetical protein